MEKRLRIVLSVMATLFLTACQLPPRASIEESYALPTSITKATTLGSAVAEQTAQHPGQSGVHILADSQQAFASRIQLVQGAEQSIDLQYYIWRFDNTGSLLTNELVKAADRGVRVRLLLDDFETTGMDAQLSRLHRHANIEVRLFNPFVMRSQKWFGFITDLDRANRRMHGKTFTVDSSVTITGGRNIADAYFGATDEFIFSDLDVLAIGPVVDDVQQEFDAYWNSKSVYPIDLIYTPDDPLAGSEPVSAIVRSRSNNEHAGKYKAAATESRFLEKLVRDELELTWASTQMLSDDPRKGLGKARDSAQLYPQLEQAISEAQQSLYLVTPYLIPTASGVEILKTLAARDVDISILTNSLAATDLAIVYAGYGKWRQELLEAGIKLYELRPTDAQLDEEQEPAGSFSLSPGSSLHAKAVAIDGQKLFIGSFNFDPRSANLNTELGFMIESPELARDLGQLFDSRVRKRAYRLTLDEQGDLVWIEHQQEQVLTYNKDPETSWCRRSYVWFMSLLPIDYFL
ncbi:phospholipase D family protein [Pseudidiomarina sp. 1APP75-27a]|uniref:phospholipase D family protein n=1 Tax=Pseudidiomarina terrestris TaxID=2820060 RepID=UPI002653720D|nr:MULTISPECIES: phospholipase D family protein [unclassified Pseudidiomarina]MDN7137215.1 phospholipase D family protein [Pseudidiomarina sp. 1ASP75-14]MEA3588511.1 phospholipase D family protein [Pseudidiomarina sp. 1APP75-27a]